MSQRLGDKHALVTGASSGIGRTVVLALAREGASLTIAARREEALESVAETAAESGVEVQCVPTDVRDPEDVERFVEAALADRDGFDIVVSNAGTGEFDPVAETSDASFRRVVETNVHGTFYLTRETLPVLVENDGNLVFVGSFAGKYPFPPGPVYAGTKGWVRMFAQSLAGSVGEEGVAVTVLNPGGVRTSFEVGDDLTQADRYVSDEAPEPEEVADSVVFACQRSAAGTVSELDLVRRDQFGDFA